MGVARRAVRRLPSAARWPPFAATRLPLPVSRSASASRRPPHFCTLIRNKGNIKVLFFLSAVPPGFPNVCSHKFRTTTNETAPRDDNEKPATLSMILPNCVPPKSYVATRFRSFVIFSLFLPCRRLHCFCNFQGIGITEQLLCKLFNGQRNS